MKTKLCYEIYVNKDMRKSWHGKWWLIRPIMECYLNGALTLTKFWQIVEISKKQWQTQWSEWHLRDAAASLLYSIVTSLMRHHIIARYIYICIYIYIYIYLGLLWCRISDGTMEYDDNAAASLRCHSDHCVCHCFFEISTICQNFF